MYISCLDNYMRIFLFIQILMSICQCVPVADVENNNIMKPIKSNEENDDADYILEENIEYHRTVTKIHGRKNYSRKFPEQRLIRDPVKTHIESQEYSHPTPQSPQICTSAECVHAASTILRHMDSEVNPCDDFYKFTCGNFDADRLIPEDESLISTFNDINDKITVQIHRLLQKNFTTELRPFRLAKSFYDLCKNEDNIEEKSVDHFRNILKKVGDWPVILGEKWNNKFYDWYKNSIACQKIGYSSSAFLPISISLDLKNSTKYLLKVGEAALGLTRDYLVKGLEDPIVKSYHEYMVNMAVLLGADKKTAASELLQSLEFEIKLANITYTKEEKRNVTATYNLMTIKELTQKYPDIPWKKYLRGLFGSVLNVRDEYIVNVSRPKFISNLIELLKSTPKRIQANYAIWKVVRGSTSYLTKEARNIKSRFISAVYGITQDPPRWKICNAHVENNFDLALAALYVRNYVQADVKKNMLEMVTGIRSAFKSILENADWMQEVTRKNALEKAETMINHIAYPDELLDDNKLEKYYKNLKMSSDSFLQAGLDILKFSREIDVKHFLTGYFDKSAWTQHSSSSTVNAFYSPVENSIEFPAGILQGLFYHFERPKYLNYGGIGYVIGHEITHGFDNKGRTFDKNGNFINWWDPETSSKYLNRTTCIIDQYSNYNVSELNMNINGKTTQGENIADNGGLKTAYIAYNNWVQKNGIEPQLPGLNYTNQQMFWISSSNVWCAKRRPEIAKLRILTDEHSPPNFRTNGVLSNFHEFSADFQCSPGSNMNPKDKCSVW